MLMFVSVWWSWRSKLLFEILFMTKLHTSDFFISQSVLQPTLRHLKEVGFFFYPCISLLSMCRCVSASLHAHS